MAHLIMIKKLADKEQANSNCNSTDAAMLQQRIAQLERRLQEAEAVIHFYGDMNSWRPGDDNNCIAASVRTDDIDRLPGLMFMSFSYGGKRARDYLSRYPLRYNRSTQGV
jgi:hypothetical protein